MIFLIIFIVERINRYNSMIFGLPSFIPGLPFSSPPNNQSTTTTTTTREKNKLPTNNKTKKRSK